MFKPWSGEKNLIFPRFLIVSETLTENLNSFLLLLKTDRKIRFDSSPNELISEGDGWDFGRWKSGMCWKPSASFPSYFRFPAGLLNDSMVFIGNEEKCDFLSNKSTVDIKANDSEIRRYWTRSARLKTLRRMTRMMVSSMSTDEKSNHRDLCSICLGTVFYQLSMIWFEFLLKGL